MTVTETTRGLRFFKRGWEAPPPSRRPLAVLYVAPEKDPYAWGDIIRRSITGAIARDFSDVRYTFEEVSGIRGLIAALSPNQIFPDLVLIHRRCEFAFEAAAEIKQHDWLNGVGVIIFSGFHDVE